MTKTSIIAGGLLIAVAATAIGIRRHWLTTIKEAPVDMPISMAAGHVSTGDFKIDISYSYQMVFEFDRDDRDGTLDCLTGITAFGNCANTPSVIDAKWVLTSNRKVIQKGTTQYQRLGWFHGKSGQHYRLDIDFLKDGSRLASANPRLVIYPGPEFGESLGAAYLYVELLAYLCAALGAVVILSGLFMDKARKQEARGSSTSQ